MILPNLAYPISGAPARGKAQHGSLAGNKWVESNLHLATEFTDSHGKCARILGPKNRLPGPDHNPSWLVLLSRAEEHIVCHLLPNQPSCQPDQGLSEILRSLDPSACQARIREGPPPPKKRFYLGLSPKQRTPPTHPYGLPSV